MSKPKRKIDGQYVPHLAELLKSPAWQVLSLSARRLLDRIEIAHLRHGGKHNGRLCVTFDDFVRYGIHRHAIAPAIRECCALGLLVITVHGRAGNAEFRSANQFLLTYLPIMGTKPATHQWRQIDNLEQAEAAARAARAPIKKQNPSAGFCQISVSETGTKTTFSVSETITETPVSETITTI